LGKKEAATKDETQSLECPRKGQSTSSDSDPPKRKHHTLGKEEKYKKPFSKVMSKGHAEEDFGKGIKGRTVRDLTFAHLENYY